MKSLLVIVFLFYSSIGLAQDAKPKNENFKKNSIRVGPMSFMFQSLDFKYERYLNTHSSLQFGLIQVLDPSFIGQSYWEGQIYTLEYRYFISVKVAEAKAKQFSERDKKIIGSSVLSGKKRKKVKRTFIAPYIRYQDLFIGGGIRNGVPYPIEQFNTFGGGVIIGRVIELSHWLVMDYYIGINYQSGKEQFINAGGTTDWLNSSVSSVYRAPKAWFGWGPRAGISIGVQF